MTLMHLLCYTSLVVDELGKFRDIAFTVFREVYKLGNYDYTSVRIK